jgi:hypothetical protein
MSATSSVNEPREEDIQMAFVILLPDYKILFGKRQIGTLIDLTY